MIPIPKPITYTHPVEVRDLKEPDECVSYLYAREYNQTAAYRMRKYKPGKDMGYAEENLEPPK